MSIRIHDLINKAIELKASDIHVSAGEVPAFRVDGEIHRMNQAEPLSNDDAKRLAYSMMQSTHLEASTKNSWRRRRLVQLQVY
jgi:twitching motility protein PilT